MTRGAFDQPTREIIHRRAGGACERCRRAPVEQYHHRTPRQAGGSRSRWISLPSNGVGLCSPCHVWVERHRRAAVDHGFLVPRGIADRAGGNSTVPIVDEMDAAWLLDDYGGKTHVPHNPTTQGES